ncbi:MAG TPA: LysM peptidoglycan-binding domain-containing protein, partial [Chitinophagaceae bacterium]|nr:LysM peptidoglycan-binding domain-containing protein [Chitinophagaceae bacterium]
VKSGDKESLSRISAMNNKVPVENLRRWNNISGDNVNAGTKLIVGFLVAGELAKSNSITIVKKEEPIDNSTVKEKKADEVKKTEPLTNVNPVKEENKAIVKEEPKKEEPAKIESKVETATMPEAGYFKDNFEQQVKVYPLSKDETVTSGLFKTSSGWKDAKYYALIDGIEPGTIIKITNPSNNKSVYAKVLGQMSGIRQNQGLDIRISDAAVSALQIADSDKFIVKVNY